MTLAHRLTLAGTLTLIVIAVLPFFSFAQSTPSTDISAAIRAALLKDPQAANLSPAQLDAMVAALSAQAAAHGATAQDLTYHPGVPDPSAIPTPVDPCADVSAPLCDLGKVFGINSGDISISLGLWITSGLLAFVIWKVRKNPHLNPQPATPPLGGVSQSSGGGMAPRA